MTNAKLQELKARFEDADRLMSSKVERWSVERGEIHNRLDQAIEDGLALIREVESLRTGRVHTCHDQCSRIECVQRRRIEQLESALRPFAEYGSVCDPNKKPGLLAAWVGEDRRARPITIQDCVRAHAALEGKE